LQYVRKEVAVFANSAVQDAIEQQTILQLAKQIPAVKKLRALLKRDFSL
jgi:hypothetical protein